MSSRPSGGRRITFGEPVNVVIAQADRAEYAQLTAADLPGARVVVDGRRILTEAAFPQASLLRVGRG